MTWKVDDLAGTPLLGYAPTSGPEDGRQMPRRRDDSIMASLDLGYRLLAQAELANAQRDMVANDEKARVAAETFGIVANPRIADAKLR